MKKTGTKLGNKFLNNIIRNKPKEKNQGACTIIRSNVQTIVIHENSP